MGCTLKEISTFMTSFENYLRHGYQNKIPKGVVHSQILVCVDETWLTLLEDKGLGKKTDLKALLKMIKTEASESHPLHMRRMDLLETKQTGNLIDLARTLNTKTHVAEWSSFSR